jgi:hypothetical protein
MNIRETIRRLGTGLGFSKRRPPVSAPPDYIDFERFRHELFSTHADPEYQKHIEPLLQEVKQRFGDRIPISEFLRFVADERANLKTRMKGIVEKARAEGNSVPLEQLQQSVKADYKGPDPEAFNREIDRSVEGWRAQYGEHIPAVELFKILQDLERASGQTDTVNQFPLSEWSAQPGFHERKLLVRYNNVFFFPARRTVSEHELTSAKDLDAQMFKRFEELALPTIGFFLGLKDQKQHFAIGELDKVREQVDETVTNGSGLGARADDLLKMLKAGCDAMAAEIEKALFAVIPNEADRAAIKQNLAERRILNAFMRHQPYIDASHAEPADRLPTLLSCSTDDLRFLFQNFPPGLALAGVAAEWARIKADLRAFAIQLMNEFPEARAKLLEDPLKLELLGIHPQLPAVPVVRSGIRNCPSCGLRVFPTADGKCPNCHVVMAS